MNSYIPKRVELMKEYVPDTSCPKIKLDANESPYQTPKSVLDAIKNEVSFDDINRYPDPEMKELLSAYGKHVGVSPDRIVAGDGSDELISLIINTFMCEGGRILICEPDFSMYAFYCEFAGCDIVRYEKKNGIDIDFLSLMGAIEKENVRLVLFSNPCNPTGEICSREAILKLADNTKAIIVCDEAYMEFAPKSESVIADTQSRDNLIVLKTVSKIGLAGLRCGFAISNPSLISALKKTKSPYNLNTITQKAVSVALNNYADIDKNVAMIKSEVVRLYDLLMPYENALGFEMRKSNANFVFLRFTGAIEAKKLHAFLKENDISVRLSGETLRITAGRPEETDALMLAIGKYSK